MPDAILVSGSRSLLHDMRPELSLLWKSHAVGPKTLFINGYANGLDRNAEQYAREDMRWTVLSIPYFGHLGKAGGPVRNTVMVDLLALLRDRGNYDCYVYAWPRAGETRGVADSGTMDCARKAEHAGFMVSYQ